MLKNVYTWYATKTILDIVIHSYLHYDRIFTTIISVNDEQLRSPYNAENPLKGIIKRLNEYDDFSLAEIDPVTDTEFFRIMHGLVTETGKYPENCRAWIMHDKKYWTANQANLIEDQADPWYRQKILYQDGYGAKVLVGTK